MKISAGMGCIDEYIPYVQAGADELFCGFVPREWALRRGQSSPLNRREVLYYNVQIGSESELQILRDMQESYHVPVHITLNSTRYLSEDYPIIRDIMVKAMNLGFYSFIIADPSLLYYLNRDTLTRSTSLTLSGEIGELTTESLQLFRRMGIKRVIFPRQTPLKEIAEIIRHDKSAYPDAPISYEAFALNERCHYHGAYCNSLHCDELCHICRLPRQLSPRNAESATTLKAAPCPTEAFDYHVGESGCGLCALWQLKHAGVTHLKLVSRGNYEEATIQDLNIMRQALALVDASSTEPDYIQKLKQAVFQEGCSGNCYYSGMWTR